MPCTDYYWLKIISLEGMQITKFFRWVCIEFMKFLLTLQRMNRKRKGGRGAYHNPWWTKMIIMINGWCYVLSDCLWLERINSFALKRYPYFHKLQTWLNEGCIYNLVSDTDWPETLVSKFGILFNVVVLKSKRST